jgi:type VI secretion system protein ImpI/type VI secretion system protein
MTLTLTMLRCPETVPPQTRTVAGGEFSIGRGPENDWVLADPERGLSKCHCIFAYRSGSWQIADLSTNGTFLNRDQDPIGRGQSRDLRDGDRLNLGPYEIEVRVAETAVAVPSRPASFDPLSRDPLAAAPGRADPWARYDQAGDFGASPLAGAGADPFAVGVGSGAINLPPDYDPLAPDAVDQRYARPTQADHSAHIEDAFAPPAARTVLPEDWDREFQPQVTQPGPNGRSLAAAASVERLPPARPAPITPAAPVALPPAAAPLPPSPRDDDLLAAFLRGVGAPDVRPVDPAVAMEMLGRAFRAIVSGLRQAMIARAAVKSEFRIEQTIIRSRGNNPLKFSADDDDALIALLGAGRRTDMAAVEAVTDALRDIRLHEIATVAAMQSAVRALLSELNPAAIRHKTEHGGLSFVPAQRKAHAWDEFEALYARISQALEDDFDSVFGKAFARAYERALADASARDAEP